LGDFAIYNTMPNLLLAVVIGWLDITCK